METKKVVVTGAAGLLGKRIATVMRQRYSVIALDHASLDITNAIHVHRTLGEVKPDCVIHSAAIANPDLCERDTDLAYRVNALGTRNVAAACRAVGSSIAYISTDAVFDGTAGRPYCEYDATDPISVYGRAKLEGERYVMQQTSKFFVVRVSWLFDEGFVRRLLDSVRAGEPVAVVNDRFSSPTYTEDVACALVALIGTSHYGTYHVANHGYVSRLGQAQEVLRQAGLDSGSLKSIQASEKSSWVAPRGLHTPLAPFLIELEGVFEMPSHEDAVSRCLQKLK